MTSTESTRVGSQRHRLHGAEAIERTDKFLDQAVLSELREVRVIHGHGTGQLRRALTAFLAEHPQVVRAAGAPPEPGRRRRHGRGAEGLMALFPQSFLDDLRLQADIVQVVQETCRCAASAASYKGLCPFHNEKTPSFDVDPRAGLLPLLRLRRRRRRVQVRRAAREGRLPGGGAHARAEVRRAIPETTDARDDAAARRGDARSADQLHEVAAAYFREQLAPPAGRARPRSCSRSAASTPQTIEQLGFGFAPPSRERCSSTAATARASSPGCAVKAGLVVERDGGEIVDRFRNRLMMPICRDTGSVVAFGGRAMDADQVPEVSEPPGDADLLEGPHALRPERDQGRDPASGLRGAGRGLLRLRAGVPGAAAPRSPTLRHRADAAAGAALRRFARRSSSASTPTPPARAPPPIVRSAGREGFDVNVALLPPGAIPTLLVREEGGEAYRRSSSTRGRIWTSCVDRAARQHDTATPAGSLAFLNAMLAVAASIPEAAARDQFADRLSLRAGISEDVVRDEIRKAAVARRTTAPAPRPVSAGAAHRGRARPADAPHVHAGRRRRRGDGAGAGRPGGAGGAALLESAQVLARDERTQGRSGGGGLPAPVGAGRGRRGVPDRAVGRGRETGPGGRLHSGAQGARATRERQEIQRQIDAFQQAGGAGGGADMEELLIRKLRDARDAQAEG